MGHLSEFCSGSIFSYKLREGQGAGWYLRTMGCIIPILSSDLAWTVLGAQWTVSKVTDEWWWAGGHPAVDIRIAAETTW